MNELNTLVGVFLGAFIALIGFVSGFYLGRVPIPSAYPESVIQHMPDAISVNPGDALDLTQPEYVPFDDDGTDGIATVDEDPGLDPTNWDEVT